MTGPWKSFVVVGDSFSEGMDDPYPDGTYRGWSDRVAEALAADAPDFRYANLAVRGKKIGQILAEQVPVAEAMQPELVSLTGGTNDLLRPRVDLAWVEERYDEAVRRLRATGADVVLFQGGLRHFPGSGFFVDRVVHAREVVDRVAARHGAVVVHLADEPVFTHPTMWSVDRLHLSAQGHERVAGAVLEALGRGGGDPGRWRDVPPPAPHASLVDRVRTDVHWLAIHLGPWVGRRLRGRSSGDGRSGKRPDLAPLAGG